MLKQISIALAGTALLCAPAVSAQDEKSQAVVVSHADLDLATQQGREELDRRIDSAAKSACGVDEKLTGSRVTSRESRNCYRNAKRQLDQHFAQLIEDQRLGG